jgi:hypothetical protein
MRSALHDTRGTPRESLQGLGQRERPPQRQEGGGKRYLVPSYTRTRVHSLYRSVLSAPVGQVPSRGPLLRNGREEGGQERVPEPQSEGLYAEIAGDW